MIMNYQNYKILIAFTILIIVISKVQSQNNFVSTGANISGSGGTLSYSLGQLTYSALNGLSGSIYQGVQQPYEIYTVGIEDVKLNISLSIYPNPSTNVVFLQADFTDQVPTATLEITNLLGALVYSEQLALQGTLFQRELSLTEQFTNGVYVAIVRCGSQVAMSKFVVAGKR